MMEWKLLFTTRPFKLSMYIILRRYDRHWNIDYEEFGHFQVNNYNINHYITYIANY